MPTIVDSLILELKLDPSGFDEGQRRAAQSLHDLETNAERAGQRVGQSGSNVVDFFRTLESPIAGVKRHFEELARAPAAPQRGLRDLAAQGRRTGAEVEAGALEGAAGLRVLGAAGLGAFAAISAVNKAMGLANESAQKVFGAGLGAAAAGVPIQEFTAISQALLHRGNVPEADTQNFLAGVRTAQVQIAAGHPEAAVALNTLFAQIAGQTGGPQANAISDTPEQIIAKLADDFHRASGDVAIGLGELIGLSPVLSLELHNLGASALEAQAALEKQRSTTAADSAAAKELIESQNSLDIASSHLGRALANLVDGPLADFNFWVADIRDKFANWLSGKGWVGTINPPGSPGPGATRLPGGGVEAPIGTGGGTLSGGGAIPAAIGGQLSSDDIAIMQRESRGNPNIGTGSGGPGVDLSGASLDASGFPIWGGTVDPKTGLRSHAAGLWQIEPALWHHYAPLVGVHDFSPESQLKVRNAIKAAEGNKPWEASGDVLPVSPAPSIAAPSLPRPDTSYARGILVPGTPYSLPRTDADVFSGGTFTKPSENEAGKVIPIAPPPGTDIAKQLKVIQTSQAAGNQTTHNYGDVNIGDVHVATQATDGPGTGIAVADELSRRLALASQANTGLS